MQQETYPLLHHHSLHLSPSIHPAPGVMYLTHPIFSLNLFPRCFHFLSPSPPPISFPLRHLSGKTAFPPPHMLTCSLPHPLSSVPCSDFPAAANNTPPFRSSRSPASSFIVPHTLPFILRHTLQLAGHPLLYLLYLSLLWFIHSLPPCSF